jgi:hypothetical protein
VFVGLKLPIVGLKVFGVIVVMYLSWLGDHIKLKILSQIAME